MNLEDKKLGTFIGLAVGGAMGAPYEFQHRSHYVPTKEYNTGGAHNVSIGEWTDTVGAVYGQIAGAYYGLYGIPQYYKDNLMQYDKILQIGKDLIGYK